MENLDLTRTIAASPSKVWEVLWNADTYPAWTSVFSGTSRAESDWKEGSEIKFLDGNGSGMIALIRSKVPNQYMSFTMLGIVEDGKEIREGEKVDQWKGGQENYTLTEVNGNTELAVHLDTENMDPGMLAYFREVWPKALDKVEELATKN